MYASIILDIINNQVNRTYDYHIPLKYENVLEIGHRVKVSFGSRSVMGFVVKISETTEYDVKKIKDVIEIIDLIKPLNEEFVNLTYQMAKDNYSFYISCLNTMLPTALKVKYKKKLILKNNTDSIELNNYFKTKKEVIFNSDLDPYLIDIKEAIKKGDIELVDQIYDNAKAKTIKMVSLIDESINPGSKKGMELINYLLEIDEDISYLDLINELGYSRTVINNLESKKIVSIYEKEIYREVYNKIKYPNKKVNLNLEQKNAFLKIKNSFNETKTFLLHGVTGSGKTEVYLEIIEEILKNKKTAILLVPEIGLTPQVVQRFKGRFKDEVAILHSRLSIGEKYDEWRKILEDKCHIVVGARSAIFAPLKNLGVIIIDECHEDSYVQFDSNPKYSAIEVAKYRSVTHKCPLILGSATPKVNDYFNALEGDYELLRLNKRPLGVSLPDVDIVDMRVELQKGNKSVFSKKLQEKIITNFNNKAQTILFLNRRGFASFVMCRECGEEIKCPACDISLTYHKHDNKLKCHYCGYEEDNVVSCPKCNSSKIRFVGSGTEKIVEELQVLLPHARVLRMDNDTTRKKNSHEEIYQSFLNNEADILVGTQMIAKGLDFPNVTLVGVINADIALKYPSYDSAEKCYSILEQVSGRAGRAKEKGEVIIQSYSVSHESITKAQEHDYDGFYDYEIKRRKMALNPPFTRLIEIEISSLDASIAYNYAKNIVLDLNETTSIVYGPTESVIFKKKNFYSFTIHIKILDSLCEEKITYINEVSQKMKDIYIDIRRL